MTRSALLSIVAASLLASVAFAAVRPRYGGILRLTTGVAPVSVDPANSTIDTLATRNIYRLMFDTLVVLDTRGKPQPALATSWQAEPGDQRWHFQLRSGLTFQDGTAIGADAVAASLRAANASWKIFPTGNGIDIECQSPEPSLPAQLALPAYEARRATAEGRHIANAGVDLLALVFSRDARSADESKLRDALAMGIDRSAINNGLLQAQGEPAGTLQPNWMTGYAFLFPAAL